MKNDETEKKFYRALKINDFLNDYARGFFTFLFGALAVVFFFLGIQYSPLPLLSIPCIALAILSFVYIPRIVKHKKHAIYHKYGNKIIGAKIVDARKLISSSSSIYIDYLISRKLDRYEAWGFFVKYRFHPKHNDSFLESIEENKKYDLNGELIKTHTEKCIRELHELLDNSIDLNSNEAKIILDSWIDMISLLKPRNKISIEEAKKEATSYHERILELRRQAAEEGERRIKEEFRRMQAQNPPKPIYPIYNRLYKNHCWFCKGPIDSERNTLCPKCHRFYICPRCGYCRCGYNAHRN